MTDADVRKAALKALVRVMESIAQHGYAGQEARASAYLALTVLYEVTPEEF